MFCSTFGRLMEVFTHVGSMEPRGFCHCRIFICINARHVHMAGLQYIWL